MDVDDIREKAKKNEHAKMVMLAEVKEKESTNQLKDEVPEKKIDRGQPIIIKTLDTRGA